MAPLQYNENEDHEKSSFNLNKGLSCLKRKQQAAKQFDPLNCLKVPVVLSLEMAKFADHLINLLTCHIGLQVNHVKTYANIF